MALGARREFVFLLCFVAMELAFLSFASCVASCFPSLRFASLSLPRCSSDAFLPEIRFGNFPHYEELIHNARAGKMAE